MLTAVPLTALCIQWGIIVSPIFAVSVYFQYRHRDIYGARRAFHILHLAWCVCFLIDVFSMATDHASYDRSTERNIILQLVYMLDINMLTTGLLYLSNMTKRYEHRVFSHALLKRVHLIFNGIWTLWHLLLIILHLTCTSAGSEFIPCVQSAESYIGQNHPQWTVLIRGIVWLMFAGAHGPSTSDCLCHPLVLCSFYFGLGVPFPLHGQDSGAVYSPASLHVHRRRSCRILLLSGKSYNLVDHVRALFRCI